MLRENYFLRRLEQVDDIDDQRNRGQPAQEKSWLTRQCQHMRQSMSSAWATPMNERDL